MLASLLQQWHGVTSVTNTREKEVWCSA